MTDNFDENIIRRGDVLVYKDQLGFERAIRIAEVYDDGVGISIHGGVAERKWEDFESTDFELKR